MKSNFLIASLLIAFIGNAQFNSNAPWRNSNSQGRQEEQTINQLVDELCSNGMTLIYVGHFESQLPTCIEKRILLEIY